MRYAFEHARANGRKKVTLLLGAVMMLVHIGQSEVAAQVHNAWLCTLDDGVFTTDLPGVAGAAVKTGLPPWILPTRSSPAWAVCPGSSSR